MPPQTAPDLLVAARTDPGCDPAKAVNEDAYLATRRPDATLLVVCDGMGGHEGGRVASNTATQVLKSLFEASMPPTGHARYLRQLLETAGRAVHALASGEESEFRPGSTCVAILFTSTGVAIAHAGDSRAYLLRSGVIERLTQDHSVINDLVMAGIMSPTEAKNHPDAHRITRALGMNAQVVVDVREMQDIRTSDQFLLCSDGLTDLVDDIEIARMLGGSRQEDIERACSALIELAKQRGGHDNITVVVAHVVASRRHQPEAGELLPTASDTSTVVPAIKVTLAQVQPTIALSDPREARVAPTVVESALRSPSGTETVPLAIPQGPPLESTPVQAAGTNIEWDTSHRDYAATPRSGARFMLIAAIISGLVILGLLFWAILR